MIQHSHMHRSCVTVTLKTIRMLQHVSALKFPWEVNVSGKKIVTLIDQKKRQGNSQYTAISTNNLHHTVCRVLFTAHALRRLYRRPGAHLEERGTEPDATYFMFHFPNYVIKSRCKYKRNIKRFATAFIGTQI